MLRGFLGILLLLIALGLTGCASFDAHGNRLADTFPGVRHDIDRIGQTVPRGAKLCMALDLPWSLIVDTIAWPIDLIRVSGVQKGFWLDERNRVKYLFVSYDSHRWPDIVIDGDWHRRDDSRNCLIESGVIYIDGMQYPGGEDGYAWLALRYSSSQIQLGPDDVVSNSISVAAEPTPQLIKRVVELREELRKQKVR
jgi:uncharacterized protein YceK